MDACIRPESIDRGDGPLPAGDHRRPAVAAGVRSCLAFFLGDTEMALPLTDVRETGQLAAVAPLPNLPGWIRGILHRRGEILSVVDLACFLGLPASQWTGPGQPYLLFRQSDLACCLEVARVGAVVHPRPGICRARGQTLRVGKTCRPDQRDVQVSGPGHPAPGQRTFGHGPAVRQPATRPGAPGGNPRIPRRRTVMAPAETADLPGTGTLLAGAT